MYHRVRIGIFLIRQGVYCSAEILEIISRYSVTVLSKVKRSFIQTYHSGLFSFYYIFCIELKSHYNTKYPFTKFNFFPYRVAIVTWIKICSGIAEWSKALGCSFVHRAWIRNLAIYSLLFSCF